MEVRQSETEMEVEVVVEDDEDEDGELDLLSSFKESRNLQSLQSGSVGFNRTTSANRNHHSSVNPVSDQASPASPASPEHVLSLSVSTTDAEVLVGVDSEGEHCVLYCV